MSDRKRPRRSLVQQYPDDRPGPDSKQSLETHVRVLRGVATAIRHVFDLSKVADRGVRTQRLYRPLFQAVVLLRQ